MILTSCIFLFLFFCNYVFSLFLRYIYIYIYFWAYKKLTNLIEKSDVSTPKNDYIFQDSSPLVVWMSEWTMTHLDWLNILYIFNKIYELFYLSLSIAKWVLHRLNINCLTLYSAWTVTRVSIIFTWSFKQWFSKFYRIG